MLYFSLFYTLSSSSLFWYYPSKHAYLIPATFGHLNQLCFSFSSVDFAKRRFKDPFLTTNFCIVPTIPSFMFLLHIILYFFLQKYVAKYLYCYPGQGLANKLLFRWDFLYSYKNAMRFIGRPHIVPSLHQHLHTLVFNSSCQWRGQSG